MARGSMRERWQVIAEKQAGLVRYKLNDDGTITTINPPEENRGSSNISLGYQASDPAVGDYYNQISGKNVYTSLQSAQNAQAKQQQEQFKKAEQNLKNLQKQYEGELSKERQYSALAGQIAGLAGTSPLVAQQFPGGGPAVTPANAAEANALAAQIASLAGPAATPAGTTQTLAAQLGAAQQVGIGGGPSNQPPPQFPGGRIGQDTYLTGIQKVYDEYSKKIADATKKKDTKKVLSLERERNAKIGQETTKFVQSYIAPAAAATTTAPITAAGINQAVSSLGAENLLGSSGLAARLNFQVSDQQILDDYNRLKLGRLNNIVEQGNSQIAAITQRINTANQLLAGIPANDPRRTSSQVVIDGLKKDLASVTSAVRNASRQVTGFKPLTLADRAGAQQISSFREFIKLPEERALDQIFQIDPETMRTAVGLGQSYRQFATTPVGPTTTPETEALRRRIEGEAQAQLQLGATLGAEERRQYEQAARAAQVARGNIFGVAPAVEEAVTTGRLGEERKLQRYGAAAQFLASGETTGAALARDIALRDALTQQRLGAASGFIASGPSLYNLAGARTGAQQAAFQNYVAANQALPGGFQTQRTQIPFYQTANPEIPVQLSGQAAQIYNTMSNYQAQTYGDYARAVASQPSGAQQFGAILSGISGLIPSFSFSK